VKRKLMRKSLGRKELKRKKWLIPKVLLKRRVWLVLMHLPKP
jgi:hypothetical protein